MKAAPLTASICEPFHRALISLSLVSCFLRNLLLEGGHVLSSGLQRGFVGSRLTLFLQLGGRSMEKQTTAIEIDGPNHATLSPAPFPFQSTSLHLLFRCIHGTALYRTSLIVTRLSPSSRTILPNLITMH
jgi:hypothetical protein